MNFNPNATVFYCSLDLRIFKFYRSMESTMLSDFNTLNNEFIFQH